MQFSFKKSTAPVVLQGPAAGTFYKLDYEIKPKYSMQIINKPRLVETIGYYDPLLRRYARRLVHNEEAAASIVLEVLECQYELNLLMPGKHLRLVLKTDVLNYCFYYMQVKMFDRKAEKLLSKNHLKLHLTRGALKPPSEN